MSNDIIVAADGRPDDSPGTASVPAMPDPPAPMTETEINTHLVRLLEGLIPEDKLPQVLGLDLAAIAAMLADPDRSAAVQRLRLKLIRDGSLVRDKATSLAYDGLDVVQDILHDDEASPAVRVEAEKTLLRAGGIDKPLTEAAPRAVFTLNIIRASKRITITGGTPIGPDEPGGES